MFPVIWGIRRGVHIVGLLVFELLRLIGIRSVVLIAQSNKRRPAGAKWSIDAFVPSQKRGTKSV